GLRTAPTEAGTTQYQVAMVTHMDGDPLEVTLGDWLQIDLADWRVAIAAPGVNLKSGETVPKSFRLADSQAVLLECSADAAQS
ncbi:MAG: glucosylglycerol hydrolase, partial [Cyanobacteria bacterium P01_C01_bin.70]